LGLAEWFCFKPARFLAAFDYNVIDQFVVDGVGRIGKLLSRIQRWVDDHVVDGILVNGFGWVSLRIGAGLRSLQTGSVQNYLLAVALGVGALVLWATGVFG
jgi:NADH:ubiquinone oxidoreductase subunit 5 (subunit L)/multisubunit Na+/H+ antiporter MnhA subunit